MSRGAVEYIFQMFTVLVIISKKNWTYRIVNADIPADHKKVKYLDLARELKKLWNMKVTVISIVNGVLRTVPKGLEKELEELEIGWRAKTIQNTALLRSARILRRVQ